jgi:hypothetical protein
LLHLTIPEPSGVLFEASLGPPSPAVDKLRKESSVDEGEIITLRGKKNKVAVGLPYYENLTSRLQNLDEEIPYEIKKLTGEYDFHYVRLACSFLPDDDCRFEWARFGVDLKSKGSGSVQTKPISWDISPREVFSIIKCKRESSFTPELKFNIIPDVIDAGIEGGVNESKEYVVYEPQITSFGLNRPSVIWEFRNTKERGILGNKSLLLIVKAPKESKISGRFLIGAEVASKLSRWMPFPVKTSDDNVINIEYDISK